MSDGKRLQIGQIIAKRNGERFVVAEITPALDQMLLRAASGYIHPFKISEFACLIVEGDYAVADSIEQPLIDPIPRHIFLTDSQKEGEHPRSPCV
jgi:hypothetical protein